MRQIKIRQIKIRHIEMRQIKIGQMKIRHRDWTIEHVTWGQAGSGLWS